MCNFANKFLIWSCERSPIKTHWSIGSHREKGSRLDIFACLSTQSFSNAGTLPQDDKR